MKTPEAVGPTIENLEKLKRNRAWKGEWWKEDSEGMTALDKSVQDFESRIEAGRYDQMSGLSSTYYSAFGNARAEAHRAETEEDRLMWEGRSQKCQGKALEWSDNLNEIKERQKEKWKVNQLDIRQSILRSLGAENDVEAIDCIETAFTIGEEQGLKDHVRGSLSVGKADIYLRSEDPERIVEAISILNEANRSAINAETSARDIFTKVDHEHYNDSDKLNSALNQAGRVYKFLAILSKTESVEAAGGLAATTEEYNDKAIELFRETDARDQILKLEAGII
jgi:hypothetical protein